MNCSINHKIFDYIIGSQNCFSNNTLTFLYGHCNDFPSLGFVLPKHLGSACKRNLFKRRCRSLFRDMNKERGVINLGLIIKPKSCDIIYPNIRRGFTGLLQELISK